MSYKTFGTSFTNLQLWTPSYGIFAKTGQAYQSNSILGNFWVGSFSDPTCANNLIWLKAKLGQVVFTKSVALCLSFPLIKF